MTITVGTDTYVTIAEADALIASMFLSADAQLLAWNNLSDADKEIALRRATVSLERLVWVGQKYDSDQVLFFPRVTASPIPNRRGGSYRQDQEYQTFSPASPTVPDAIKNAEVYEALEIASPSTDTDNFDDKNATVKSEKVGDWSANYGGGNTGVSARSAQAIIKSKMARDYIAPFLSGGYRTV